MRLTIEPTEGFFMLGDVMVRMWQGHADDGSPVLALVTAVASAGQSHEFAAGLVPIPPPDAAAARRWAQEVMRRAADEPKPDWQRSPEAWRDLAAKVVRELPPPPGPGELRPHPDPYMLLMVAFPAGMGPYNRYELRVHHTDELLDAGAYPPDQERIGMVVTAYREAVAACLGEAP